MLGELLIHHSWFLYTCIGLLSLCVGSLLNVVIYRLPIMLQQEWRQQCEEILGKKNTQDSSSLNLFTPRSFCQECKKQVLAWQNIPLISYILLRGSCYYCKKRISLRYPIIELLTMLLSLYASWHFGFTLYLPFVLLMLWVLIPLFFIDLEHQLLPDSLTLSLLWLGLIANTYSLFTDLPNAVLSAAGAYLFLWLFIRIFYLLTGKVGMGNGDFKLFAAFGAWFGFAALPLILLFSSLTGAVIGLIYLKINNKSHNTTIPFGPFLCVAGIIYLFYGVDIIYWYVHHILGISAYPI